MKYRYLGPLNVSVIGYGTLQFPQLTQEVVTQCVNRAIELGVNFFDTARNYGDSEHKLATAIGDSNRRDSILISTKTTERTAKGAKRDLFKSLGELATDHIDLWMFHNVDQVGYDTICGLGGALETGLWAIREGIITSLGISIHRDLKLMQAAILSDQFDAILLAFSAIDHEGTKELFPLCIHKRTGIFVMKPLCGGSLILPGSEMLPLGDPAVNMNLRYIIWNHPEIASVLVGMTSLRQVEQNCAAGMKERPLGKAAYTRLLKLIGSTRQSFRYGQTCLRCGYCLPCKAGIDIPEIMRAYDEYVSYPPDQNKFGLLRYQRQVVKPDACLLCRRCARRCPAGLDVPTKLKEIRDYLEPKVG